MKKWSRTILGAIAASALALSACAGGGTDAKPADSSAPAAKEEISIGIATLVSHPALDAAQEGFIEGLKEAGYEEGKNLKLDKKNANADQSTLTNIASTFANSDADLFYAIATPTAQALAQSITDRPVVFAAVTEPVEAGLVASWDAPDANVTGVSDMNPMGGQVALIQEILPNVKKIGIVYSSGEVNSEVQVKQAKEAAEAAGIEVVTATVTNSSEVQQGAQSIDADVFLIPTDNIVVSAAESVIQVAEQKGIPVIASDTDTMARGAAAGLSVNYTQQGKDAAKIALRLLAGEKASAIPVETQKEFDLYVNVEAAKKQGIELPQAVIDRAAKQF